MQSVDGIAVPTMVTPDKAAKLTGLAVDHIRGLCKMGKIVHVKAGKKFLINLERFVEYLNKGDDAEDCEEKSLRQMSNSELITHLEKLVYQRR